MGAEGGARRLVGGLDLDPLRLRRLQQRDAELQCAALEFRVDIRVGHNDWKRDPTADGTVRAIAAVEPLALLLVLLGVLALDGEHALVHVDVDLITIESG